MENASETNNLSLCKGTTPLFSLNNNGPYTNIVDNLLFYTSNIQGFLSFFYSKVIILVDGERWVKVKCIRFFSILIKNVE